MGPKSRNCRVVVEVGGAQLGNKRYCRNIAILVGVMTSLSFRKFESATDDIQTAVHLFSFSTH